MPDPNIELQAKRAALVERVEALRAMAMIPGEGAATELEDAVRLVDDLLTRLELRRGQLRRAEERCNRQADRAQRAARILSEDLR